jgi:peptide/nickel transport system permease protein
MKSAAAVFRQLGQYPSALAGMAIIAFLIVFSLVTMVVIPYGQALELWRGGEHWQQTPVNARPVWTSWITRENLPRTVIARSGGAKVDVEAFPGGRRVVIPLEVEFPFSAFPSEMNLFLQANYREREPFVRMTWHTPDGREIRMGGRRVVRSDRVSISQDWDLERRLGEIPHVGLFADPAV